MSQGNESFAGRLLRGVKNLGAKIKGIFVRKKKEEPAEIIDPATGKARPIAREMTRRQYLTLHMRSSILMEDQ